jgi:hypothetical protein
MLGASRRGRAVSSHRFLVFEAKILIYLHLIDFGLQICEQNIEFK